MKWERYLHGEEDKNRRKFIRNADKGPWFDGNSNSRHRRGNMLAKFRQSYSATFMVARKVLKFMKNKVETIGALFFISSLFLSGYVAGRGNWLLSLLIPVTAITIAALAFTFVDNDGGNNG